jgi:hypothetical protein
VYRPEESSDLAIEISGGRVPPPKNLSTEAPVVINLFERVEFPILLAAHGKSQAGSGICALALLRLHDSA